jgi:hypothetical protein
MPCSLTQEGYKSVFRQKGRGQCKGYGTHQIKLDVSKSYVKDGHKEGQIGNEKTLVSKKNIMIYKHIK